MKILMSLLITSILIGCGYEEKETGTDVKELDEFIKLCSNNDEGTMFVHSYTDIETSKSWIITCGTK